jgi:hypothetical protein
MHGLLPYQYNVRVFWETREGQLLDGYGKFLQGRSKDPFRFWGLIVRILWGCYLLVSCPLFLYAIRISQCV